MQTKCVRLHGQNDLRLETIELPEIKDDEILVKNISDSICMSSYKAAIQGANHKRVPDDVAENPVIIGHEFCGEIVKVGARWEGKFKAGEKFSIQPAINYHGTLMSPGYSFPHVGGDTQYAILMPEVMENNCLLHYDADEYFYGSLSEPLSCIVGAYHAQYHTEPGSYVHKMGIVEGEESTYGMWVTAVDFETADESKQQWWGYTVNGEFSSYGVDSQVIADGDEFTFTLHVGY